MVEKDRVGVCQTVSRRGVGRVQLRHMRFLFSVQASGRATACLTFKMAICVWALKPHASTIKATPNRVPTVHLCPKLQAQHLLPAQPFKG